MTAAQFAMYCNNCEHSGKCLYMCNVCRDANMFKNYDVWRKSYEPEITTTLNQAMRDAVLRMTDVNLCGIFPSKVMADSIEYDYSYHGKHIVIAVPNIVSNISVRCGRFVDVMSSFIRDSMGPLNRRYRLTDVLCGEKVKTYIDKEVREIRYILGAKSIKQMTPINYSFDDVMNVDISKELTMLNNAKKLPIVPFDVDKLNAALSGGDFDGDAIKIDERTNTMKLAIKNVIFNNPATIVFWLDGTKTVVKAENEPFDPEKGLAMAIVKKTLGNKGSYYNEFKKWLKNDG